MNLKTLFICLSIVLTINSCANWADITKELDPTKGLSSGQIYNEGKSFLNAGDFINAIKYF